MSTPAGPPPSLSIWACLPVVPLLASWLLWIPFDGGYFPHQWYPGALLAVLTLLLTAFALRRLRPPRRGASVALAGLGALVLLQYLSAAWSPAPADALEAGNKLLLVLATAWTVSLLPWTGRRLAALAGAWALGVAVVCAQRVIAAAGQRDITSFFDVPTGRWNDPLAYPNGASAIAAVGLLAALVAGSRRGLTWWARPPLVAAAAFLAQFSLLPQSRGLIVGLAVALPLLLLVDGDRRRLVPRALLVVGAVAFSARDVIDVGRAAEAQRAVGALLDTALGAMALATLAAFVLAAVLEVVEWRLARASAARPLPRPRLVVVLAAVALALVAAGVAVGPRAIGAVSDKVADARRLKPGEEGRSRLLSAEPEERLDYARVALEMFRERPLLGAGARSFEPRYDAAREYPKHSRYTHMIFLRVLAETGIAGVLALLALLGGLAWAGWAARRSLPPWERGLVALGAALGGYLLGHASLDWMEEFSAIAAPVAAFAFAGAVLGAPAARRLPSRLAPSPARQLLEPAAAVAVGLLALLLLVPPYLGDRYLRRAHASYEAHPNRALKDTERAARLDPLGVDALHSEGTIAVSLGRYDRARAAFEQALERQDSWYAWLELALLDAQEGRRAEARLKLRRARALNSADPMLDRAAKLISSGKRVSPGAFNRSILQTPLYRVRRIA